MGDTAGPCTNKQLGAQLAHLVVGVQQQERGRQLRVARRDGVHIQLGAGGCGWEAFEAGQLHVEQRLRGT